MNILNNGKPQITFDGSGDKFSTVNFNVNLLKLSDVSDKLYL